ncbi:Guanosine-diphosphatase [Cyberlindnera fabianii]|nr:Guanosine-diphosphatase [Cyberlindnera fabianii]
MAGISLSPSVRNSRFVIASLVIFTVVMFFITSPPAVTSSIEKAKSTFDLSSDSSSSFGSSSEEAVFPPKDAVNSPQYPEDNADGAAPVVDQGTSPQFADDTAKDAAAGSGEDPKAADKGTPIKQAPKPNGGAGGSEKGSGSGEFNAIKDDSKAYAGVPDKSSDDEDAVEGNKGTASEPKSIANCKKDSEFVVMVDAGSTGSRVHVYEFDTCYSPPKLLKETFEMLKPGLSSFDTDTAGAAKSLDPLLKIAVDTVPAKARGCTPIAVKATAGLRLLGEEKSKNILKAVRTHLENDYPFAVVEGDGISIMSGDDEGVYAWITANYLLGNIGSADKFPTAAVFDLGGGSTQIVFEPEFKNGEKMVDGEHKYEISFGNRDFELYQFSHLGYGLMAGRNKINSLLVETAIKDGKLEKTATKGELTSPCIPPGMSAKDVEVKLDNGDKYSITFKGSETPAGAQCRFLAEAILKKDAECSVAPCSFNGVHQPSLIKTFRETSDLYVFSYFYDRTNPLGMPSSFTVGELTDLAKVVCNGESTWTDALSAIDGSIKELKEEPQWCLDLSFQVALLHTGYDIPLHRELKTAKKIADNELGWCLGASLPLLDGKGWSCRVAKVDG